MTLDLALVIPAHNDTAGLARLLRAAHDAAIFSQIIVVDDGSTPAVGPRGRAQVIRNMKPCGAGAARNLGLGRVTAEYVMFCDADDLILPELGLLVGALCTAGPFDFCHFKHADSRRRADGIWGQLDIDEAQWIAAGVSQRVLSNLQFRHRPVMAQTGNYPWNKIFRTAFLREHAIECAPTPVHNDMPLHWRAYLRAGRILTSDRVCVLHHVDECGARLSNLSGRARFALFDVLEIVARDIARAEPAWHVAFARFVLGLLDWCEGVITPDLRDEFRATSRRLIYRWPWWPDCCEI